MLLSAAMIFMRQNHAKAFLGVFHWVFREKPRGQYTPRGQKYRQKSGLAVQAAFGLACSAWRRWIRAITHRLCTRTVQVTVSSR